MREAVESLPIHNMAGARVYAGGENREGNKASESASGGDTSGGDPAFIFDPEENACAVLAREHGKTRTNTDKVLTNENANIDCEIDAKDMDLKELASEIVGKIKSHPSDSNRRPML